MKSLEEGQKAPFSGTLLNQAAVADVLLKLNTSEEKFKLRLKKEVETIISEYDLKIGKIKAFHKFEAEVYKEQVNFLNNQVKLSVNELKKNNFSSELWFSGGFIVGALLVLGISYVTINIDNK